MHESIKEPSREFQVFVKPAGPSCNLGCSYCYYLGNSSLYESGTRFSMPGDLLEIYIRQHMEASTGEVITFSWHGGEPLLAGVEFYRKGVALQRKYNSAQKKIINGIQTNGTLIDREWCAFLAEENFMVGISLDGPERLHDLFRSAKDGSPTFRRVMQGYDQLVMSGIDPEILCVVNAENVNYPGEVYGFFRQLGARYMTFIPLVEKQSDSPSGVSSRSVPAKSFGTFLCTVFDEWVAHDIGKVKVQIFEEALRTAFDQEHTLCIFKPVCGGVPVVEHNGDFYSCDHFVRKEHLLGNIREKSLADLLDSERQKAFGENKLSTLPQYCMACGVRQMCNGECPKNRFITAPDGEAGLNYLCEGYKMFFTHCTPFVTSVAGAWHQQQGGRVSS
ncbi:MAG TPA: anaerobic sulfatase maturase [Bacteroidales bacterium]|nr:anaerobic sulfatase maturase [Bacteroidales bacterium]